jgi:hypothetical protein
MGLLRGRFCTATLSFDTTIKYIIKTPLCQSRILKIVSKYGLKHNGALFKGRRGGDVLDASEAHVNESQIFVLVFLVHVRQFNPSTELCE